MLKMIVDRQLIVIVLGIFTALGIISKCVVNVSQKRMVRAAGNMNKSNHPLMRLVRAKFEHACMVSEKVENVEVFVDKYLYEYRIFGIRFHSIRRLEKASALLCIVTGLLGSIITYSVYGMSDRVLQIGAIGAGLGILVYVFHLSTDENYQLQMTRNYMVDYLQNVCLHRYEKAYQKDLEAKKAVLNQTAEIDEDEFEEEEIGELPGKRSGNEVPMPSAQPEILPPTMPQPNPSQNPIPNPTLDPIPDAIPPIRGINARAAKMKAAAEFYDSEEMKAEKEMANEIGEEQERESRINAEKNADRELRIRQILEEFMA
ncbi:MAG: hypothetical protein ACI4S2_17805 [Lachnospiraceae bacterium]